MHELEELRREGLSILAISELTGYDRKTIRKYLLEPEGVQVRGTGDLLSGADPSA